MLIDELNKIKKKISPNEFKEIMEMTEQDIKFNRVSFNKKTGPNEFLQICIRSFLVLRRCNNG